MFSINILFLSNINTFLKLMIFIRNTRYDYIKSNWSYYYWSKIKLTCLILIKFKVITLNRVNYFFTIKVRVFVSQVIFMQLIWTTKYRVFGCVKISRFGIQSNSKSIEHKRAIRAKLHWILFVLLQLQVIRYVRIMGVICLFYFEKQYLTG